MLTVLGERQSEFPGVAQEPVSIREYPYGEMAAQVARLRRAGHRSRAQGPAFRGVQAGTVVGQEGLEYYYDHYLRRRARACSASRSTRKAIRCPASSPRTAPQGRAHACRTTLDLGLQQESEKALLEGMEHARAGGKPAIAGAFVALDPLQRRSARDGLLAELRPQPVRQAADRSRIRATRRAAAAKSPAALDRPGRSNGEYPTGSTFKPITAMAALEAGVINPTEGLGAGQCINVSTEQFCNAGTPTTGGRPGRSAEGLLGHVLLRSRRAAPTRRRRHPGQGPRARASASRRASTCRASSRASSRPQSGWPNRTPRNRSATREHHGQPCYIVAEPGAPWTVGYNMDLAVGQGDAADRPAADGRRLLDARQRLPATAATARS